MRYLLSTLYFVGLVLLFSCDSGDGGTLPDASNKSKIFAEIQEGFKKFIEENPRQFSTSGQGLHFVGDPVTCDMVTCGVIEDTHLTFKSFPCQHYVVDEDSEFEYEVFQLGGSTIVAEDTYLYVILGFRNMGTPASGEYVAQEICDERGDYYDCYNSVSLYAYVVFGEDEEPEYFLTESPNVQVTNAGGIVSASFSEVFYYYDFSNNSAEPAFNISGSLSCCN